MHTIWIILAGLAAYCRITVTQQNGEHSWRCMVQDSVREECGHSGMDSTECVAAGCCWKESSKPDSPWCFHGTSTAPEGGGPGPEPPNGDTEGDVRLADGTEPGNGRVEIYHNGEWGTVCDDEATYGTADVVCRMVGGYAMGSVANFGTFQPGEGTIWMDDVHCSGDETSLSECPFLGWGSHNCGHEEDLGVYCTNDVETGSEMELRLVNGSAPNEGRVEIYHDNRWGTICDDLFQDGSATVVCRQLGYETGTAFWDAHFGQGTGPIHIYNAECSSDAQSLNDCDIDWEGSLHCSHYEDAGVVCGSGGEGGEANEMDIRLVNGGDTNEGRLEIYHSGEWGTVCDDGFYEESANAACRQLGYTGGTYYPDAYFGEGSGPIHVSYTGCHDAQYLSECTIEWEGDYYCSHFEDVGVSCDVQPGGEEANEMDLRLVNGGSDNEGRLEIYHNGEWGTVCDDGFHEDAANAACRQLGYESGISHGSAYFGDGTGPIHVSWPGCIPESVHFYDCYIEWDGNSYCSHWEDVGVTCDQGNGGGNGGGGGGEGNGGDGDGEGNGGDGGGGEGGTEMEIRLVNGSSPDNGRVEIYHDGEWGTICDDGFYEDSANAVCKGLGFSEGQFIHESYYGQGTGSIHVSYTECPSDADNLNDCVVYWDGDSYCSHEEDAGVQCFIIMY